MRNRFFALLTFIMASLPSATLAQKVEIVPGVTVTRKTYSVAPNEAPFFNFVE